MNLDEIMAELRREYMAAFPTKIQFLKELAEKKSWPELMVEFHKLKGNGRTHGFPEISSLGEVMEKICNSGKVDQSQVESAVALLTKIIEERINKKMFDLESSPDFQNLRKKVSS